MKLDGSCLLAAALLLPLGLPAAGGEDWPRFNGPGADNISPDRGLLPKWPAGGPKQLWSASGLGVGFSSPAVVGGVTYITGVDLASKQLRLSAFDAKGKRLWQRQLGAGWIQGGYTGARCSPTVQEGLVYVLSGKGRLTCCRIQDGKPVWTVDFKKTFSSPTPRWGFAESPIVEGDLLICTPGGPKAGMAALDRKTGKVRWTAKGMGDGPAYATPVVFTLGKLRIAAGMTAKGAMGVDVKRGRLLWTFPWETSYDVHANQLHYHEGSLYGSSGYGKGSFRLDLKVKGPKCTVKEAWRSQELDSQHHGLVLWQGRLFGSSHKTNRGAMVCLDAGSGKILYKGKGVGWSSITFADGKLYCLESRRGIVGLLSPEKGFARAGFFQLPSGGKGPYWAHPVVIGGRLYLRHADKLFVHDVKK